MKTKTNLKVDTNYDDDYYRQLYMSRLKSVYGLNLQTNKTAPIAKTTFSKTFQTPKPYSEDKGRDKG